LRAPISNKHIATVGLAMDQSTSSAAFDAEPIAVVVEDEDEEEEEEGEEEEEEEEEWEDEEYEEDEEPEDGPTKKMKLS
jgi:hypothetical protein